MRTIPSDIGPVIPIIDIVENIGYSRSAVTKTLKRHEAFFIGLTSSQSIDTRRGPQYAKCLNAEGVRRLIMLLDPSAKTNPELFKRVESFKLSVLENLGESPIPVSSPASLQGNQFQDPVLGSLRKNAERAKVLVSDYKYPEETALRLAMEAVVQECGDEARQFKGPATAPALPAPVQEDLPPADPDFERYHSLEKLSTYCQCSSKEAHRILEDEHVIECVNKIWRLTRYGERYGKMFECMPFFPHSRARRWMIRYHPDAVQLVRGKLMGMQLPLPITPRAVKQEG